MVTVCIIKDEYAYAALYSYAVAAGAAFAGERSDLGDYDSFVDKLRSDVTLKKRLDEYFLSLGADQLYDAERLFYDGKPNKRSVLAQELLLYGLSSDPDCLSEPRHAEDITDVWIPCALTIEQLIQMTNESAEGEKSIIPKLTALRDATRNVVVVLDPSWGGQGGYHSVVREVKCVVTRLNRTNVPVVLFSRVDASEPFDPLLEGDDYDVNAYYSQSWSPVELMRILKRLLRIKRDHLETARKKLRARLLRQRLHAQTLPEVKARFHDKKQIAGSHGLVFCPSPFNGFDYCIEIPSANSDETTEVNLGDALLEMDLEAGHRQCIGEKVHNVQKRSSPMNKLVDDLRVCAFSHDPVMILGEAGTGVRTIAERLHFLSCRRSFPFVVWDARMLPVESAALESRFSKLEQDATLFIQNSAYMSSQLISTLTGVLHSGTAAGLMDGMSCPDVRIRLLIGMDPLRMHTVLREGALDPRALFGIAPLVLRVPSLTDRIMDIPLLAQYFATLKLREINAERGYTDHNVRVLFTLDALAKLIELDWMGNVIELKGCVDRAVWKCVGEADRKNFRARPVVGQLVVDAVEIQMFDEILDSDRLS